MEEIRSKNEEILIKKSEETVIRKQLRRLADRLRNENEALLKLVREINAQGSPVSSRLDKKQKKT